jgi:signal peptidase I
MPSAMQPSGAETLAALFLRDASRFDDAAKLLAHQAVDFPITGNSMAPNLPAGMVVRVVLVKADSCNPGDIVVFRHAQQIVAHRVIRRTRSYLITRGDARVAPDPPVSFERVLGCVTGIIASGELQPLKPIARRHPLVRAANTITMWLAAAALRINPVLAARLSRFLTILERG